MRAKFFASIIGITAIAIMVAMGISAFAPATAEAAPGWCSGGSVSVEGLANDVGFSGKIPQYLRECPDLMVRYHGWSFKGITRHESFTSDGVSEGDAVTATLAKWWYASGVKVEITTTTTDPMLKTMYWYDFLAQRDVVYIGRISSWSYRVDEETGTVSEFRVYIEFTECPQAECLLPSGVWQALYGSSQE